MPKVPETHLEARRRGILEAACLVFCSKGMQAATMADVAKEAGITPGAIYRYFPSKDDLARHCMSDTELVMKSRWLTPAEPGEDALAGMAELARLTLGLLNNASERVETILWMERVLAAVREDDEAVLREWRADHSRIVDAISQRLEAARDARQLPASLDAHLFAEALMSFYWGARLARLIDPAADTDGHLDQLLRVLGAAERNRAAPALPAVSNKGPTASMTRQAVDGRPASGLNHI